MRYWEANQERDQQPKNQLKCTVYAIFRIFPLIDFVVRQPFLIGKPTVCKPNSIMQNGYSYKVICLDLLVS